MLINIFTWTSKDLKGILWFNYFFISVYSDAPSSFAMPASSGVGVVSSHIEGTLRASLGQCHSSGETLDQKLVSSSKRILLHNIEFAPAESDSTYQLDLLRSKYTPLNASQAKESSTGTSVSQKSKTEVVLNGYATNKTKSK